MESGESSGYECNRPCALSWIGFPTMKKRSEKSSRTRKTEAVSYTHLDVYKRQVIGTAVAGITTVEIRRSRAAGEHEDG